MELLWVLLLPLDRAHSQRVPARCEALLPLEPPRAVPPVPTVPPPAVPLVLPDGGGIAPQGGRVVRQAGSHLDLTPLDPRRLYFL